MRSLSSKCHLIIRSFHTTSKPRSPAMTEVQMLASFVERARLADLSAAAMEQLKIRVLDTIGVALGALDAGSIGAIRKLTAELGGRPLSTLIGGGRTAPD